MRTSARATCKFVQVVAATLVAASVGAAIAADPATPPPALSPKAPSLEPPQAPAASPSSAPAAATPPAKPPAAAPPPVFSPFGPPWDPTRPPPTEPGEKGAGITAATIVAIGAADIEELRGEAKDGMPYFAVVLDVKLAAGSTTATFGADSVTLEREDGAASPLKALCTPTLEDADAIWRGGGGTLRSWNIAVGGRTWNCGGRNARMVMALAEKGGVRLSSPATGDWSGPLVLLFEPRVEAARRVVLPGLRVDVASAPATDEAPAAKEAPAADEPR